MQIAKVIFDTYREIMKQTLELGEFKFDLSSKEYKFFKRSVMNSFYSELEKLFDAFKRARLIEECKCGANFKEGYKSCEHCHGAGYRNRTERETEKKEKNVTNKEVNK